MKCWDFHYFPGGSKKFFFISRRRCFRQFNINLFLPDDASFFLYIYKKGGFTERVALVYINIYNLPTRCVLVGCFMTPLCCSAVRRVPLVKPTCLLPAYIRTNINKKTFSKVDKQNKLPQTFSQWIRIAMFEK